MVGSSTALKWMLGGLGFFAAVGVGMWSLHPERRVPWAPKQVVVPPEVACPRQQHGATA